MRFDHIHYIKKLLYNTRFEPTCCLHPLVVHLSQMESKATNKTESLTVFESMFLMAIWNAPVLFRWQITFSSLTYVAVTSVTVPVFLYSVCVIYK